jgi:hypothetical protein
MPRLTSDQTPTCGVQTWSVGGQLENGPPFAVIVWRYAELLHHAWLRAAHTVTLPASRDGLSARRAGRPIEDQGVQMRLRKRAVAVVFVATAAFTSLAPQAMAAPLPWQTPTTTTHITTATAASNSGTVTVLCGNPCYQ